MSRHLRRWLNGTALRKMNDRYEGLIGEVLEERLRNRFTATKELQPVIVFDDGWRLVPNIGMRRALIEFFGPDSEDWIGNRVVVFQHRVEQVDPATGEAREVWQKAVMRADADVSVFPRRHRTAGGAA